MKLELPDGFILATTQLPDENQIIRMCLEDDTGDIYYENGTIGQTKYNEGCEVSRFIAWMPLP
jgi:hypothetical protein